MIVVWTGFVYCLGRRGFSLSPFLERNVMSPCGRMTYILMGKIFVAKDPS